MEAHVPKVIKVKGRIFNIGGDAKTVKGQKSGVLTAICYLAPAKSVSKFHPEIKGSVCPGATPGCIAGCLNKAGQGAFSNVQKGRARKTALFLQNREQFVTDVVHDMCRAANRAAVEGMLLHIRADGTSDVLTIWLARRWDQIVARAEQTGKLTKGGRAVLVAAQLYTYTKRPAKDFASVPQVHVTYSWNEGPNNAALAAEHRAAGHNVAVVFRDRATVENAMDRGFYGWPVVDGDADDNRADDPNGVVVALYAKGRAKKDRTGFVVDLADFEAGAMAAK